ncbi:MAG TPA: DUF6519 domain-containing protein [Myxococcales bacterium]|nr:DUF6519 domain-containing protein [Myxococcales bacterium]
MKGDFTGIRRWADKHYTSVRLQQGRVQLDTDWNDQIEIQNYGDRVEAHDVIGQAGGPKGAEGGFRFDKSSDGKDFTLSPGRFWVDGILCELAGTASYLKQPDLPAPPFVSSGALALQDGTYLAYLDVIERLRTVLDDPDLREPALRGADTTVRTQVMWQVKLLKVTDPGGTGACDTAFPEWPPRAPTGKLSAKAKTDGASATRCTVESTGGYRRLENQLYRVEIHKAGARSAASFKWSRENGSVVASWDGLSGDVLAVSVPGRDAVLGFQEGDWVELTDDDRERSQSPGVLVKLKKADGVSLTIDPATVDPTGTVLSYGDFSSNPKVRRWEGDLPSAKSAARPLVPTPPGDGFVDLEDGVQVKFEDGDYRSGDYWVVPARVVTGDVIWPVQSNVPVARAPLGVEHHYAKLAIVRKSGTTTTVVPCYPQFPPLTAIAASDVSFDNTACAFNPAAKTVQEALDDLCKRTGGGCTLVVGEGTDLQGFFDTLAKANPASVAVCLTTGEWKLDKAVEIAFPGSVVLEGGGPGTRILAPQAECALSFVGCKSVVVRDLHLETGVARPKSKQPGAFEHLRGTLDFRGCGSVTVEGVSLACGSALERAAACVAVRADPAKQPLASVRVRGCSLSVGHRQVGIVLVDAGRAQVEDNVLEVAARPAALGVEAGLRQDKAYRAILRRHVISNLRIVRDTATRRVLLARSASGDTVAFSAGGYLVRFETDAALVAFWREAVRGVFARLGAAFEAVDPTVIHELLLRRDLAVQPREGTPSSSSSSSSSSSAPAPQPARPDLTRGGVIRVERPPINPALLESARNFVKTTMQPAGVLVALRKVVGPKDIRSRLYSLADQMLLTRANGELKAWFKSMLDGSPAAASQGIVVGGAHADEIRIQGNTISGVLQGIHAGLSHGFAPGTTPHARRRGAPRDLGGAVWVRDNTVNAVHPLDWAGERHGIFTGNFDNVVIENNRLALRRYAKTPIDGIRVFGELGPHVQVASNRIDGFPRGIWVHPVVPPADPKKVLWLVSWNLCTGAAVTVVPEPSVDSVMNRP